MPQLENESKQGKTFKKQKTICVLGWLSESPDLNPRENPRQSLTIARH